MKLYICVSGDMAVLYATAPSGVTFRVYPLIETHAPLKDVSNLAEKIRNTIGGLSWELKTVSD